MNKQFFAMIVLVVALLFGAFWFTKKDTPTSNQSTNVQPTNHVLGKGKKGVTLVEYGDFECPACGAYYPILQQVKAKYGDDIKFQFRNFPLVQLHKHAMLAHRAAEAASNQGKFFEMHDILYERQDAWSTGANQTKILEDYAAELGLDVIKFRQDMASEAVNAAINADIKEGQALKATGTPTFVLQGKKLEESPRSLEEFNKLIDEAIAANPANQ